MDGKHIPVWDIEIGPTSVDSRVRINGVDVSRHLRSVEVKCAVGMVTEIKLGVIGSDARVAVRGAIEIDPESAVRP